MRLKIIVKSLSWALAALTATYGLCVPTDGVMQVINKTDRIIVKYKNIDQKISSVSINGHMEEIAKSVGQKIEKIRSTTTNQEIYKIDRMRSIDEISILLDKIRLREDVEYAVPDRIMHASLIPDDVFSSDRQWSLFNPEGINLGSANLFKSWDITTGSAGNVIAVIDTGILNHPDLAGKILPGYDFISDASIANDGDGRDGNAADPGDWISAVDITTDKFKDNKISNSSWHGTHVAGIAAAAGNNGIGVAGADWYAKILPVRVLGKGGGYTSDIIDGARWAAGLHVDGVPDNKNPAKVLNMSLGGEGECDPAYQAAIDEIKATGAILVVAAGNESSDVSKHTPAGCKNLITVGAVARSGSIASYSNFGAGITIAAPGGEAAIANDSGILSTGDSGKTSPNNDGIYIPEQGTSMASPIAAGVVSLMLSVNPSLNPDQVKKLLISSARAFSTSVQKPCTIASCGAGYLDAYNAVLAAKNAPIVNGGAMSITASVVGQITQQTIGIRIAPAAVAIGKPGYIFAAAILKDGTIFLRTPQTWTNFDASNPTPLNIGNLSNFSFDLVSGLNLSGLEGVDVYAGYGQGGTASEGLSNMLNQGTLSRVYTIH